MEKPPADQLLRKIQELEAGHAHLRKQMSRLKLSGAEPKSGNSRQRSHSVSPQRSRLPPPQWRSGGVFDDAAASCKRGSSSFGHSSPLQRESRSSGGDSGPVVVQLTDRQYLNILQSIGQAVHIFDLNGRIIFWNRTAENLYGYSAAEALGKGAYELLLDAQDFAAADNIVRHVMMGQRWIGQFPVKDRMGKRFLAIVTNTPFYDDGGTLIGIICVSSDSKPFQEMKVMSDIKNLDTDSGFRRPKSSATTKLGLDPDQPLQAAIASKITNLATKVSNKVRSKIKTGENNMDHESGSKDSHHSDPGLHDATLSDHKDDANSSGATTPRGDVAPSHLGLSSQATADKSPAKPGRDSGDEIEGKSAIHKIITSKAEAWIGKKAIQWPWKGNEQETSEAKATRFGWPWLHSDQDTDHPHSDAKVENPAGECNSAGPLGFCSSFNVNSASSVSSCGSTSSSGVNKVDIETDCFDYEILWEDLTIGEQVGQGSCGTVYHGLWYGSDVAIKVFSKQEYSEDALLSFRQEVSLMKRLRHPNILLFMGAVTSPQHLCIVTEFLPRGSMFRLLQRNIPKLDWRRRTLMSLDVARGINYLHHCNPPIIHRDLKSSNLLVDKNWTVKVADFGLSRIKHETYLTTKTGKGTPQWMAPEVLRNEPSDEKSDIYSFGVILWELATQKIPWEHLNSMQVIGAVGFMNQRLDIPKDVDPRWASLIESCWHSEPQCRPTFQELLGKLKELHRHYAIQFRSAAGDAAQKDE
ncbi:hypothetical protein Nepgr_030391 [Nepenthes gracilis]|uniref:non-specific serine/threonine protein kinase n=1 Tax=Nepenthes gracilis TaxID=150966 RepID=A0AAD3TEQ5_NEPGR|nr:hypothetical protein Nepgr_030391 [Nepenthes gracilis]